MERLIRLPGEVLLLIASYLDVRDLLTLRQTCHKSYQITHDRALWLSILHSQIHTLPTSHYKNDARDLESDLPTASIEETVKSTYRTAQSWALPRKMHPIKLHPKSGESLLGMEIFLDRWLLTVYAEGLLYLWDIKPDEHPTNEGTATAVRCASLDMRSAKWTSYTASLNNTSAEDPSIVIAITRASPPSATRIYQLTLKRPSIWSQNAFKLLHTVSGPIGQIVRAIEPKLQLTAFSRTTSVDIARWHDNHVCVSISAQIDDMEELWNGTIAVRFLESHILVFKARSIELYPIPFDTSPSISVHSILKHNFTISTTFRDVSFSAIKYSTDNVHNHSETKANVISLSLLAYDVLQGIFHYTVVITLPLEITPALPATLDVNLTGIYPMAHNIRSSTTTPAPAPTTSNMTLFPPTLPSPRPQPWSPSPPVSPEMDYTPTPTPTYVFGETAARFGTNISARGFVSAYDLGPQGKRAVWVERKRGSTVREVIVWTREPGSIGAGEMDLGDEEMEMDGRVIYALGSYDLREDLTHCALGEVGGQIVLGNRAGEVFILGLG